MSSRIIQDKQPEIYFTKTCKGTRVIPPKGRFIEVFQNKYYPQIKRQKQLDSARDKEIEVEHASQI